MLVHRLTRCFWSSGCHISLVPLRFMRLCHDVTCNQGRLCCETTSCLTPATAIAHQPQRSLRSTAFILARIGSTIVALDSPATSALPLCRGAHVNPSFFGKLRQVIEDSPVPPIQPCSSQLSRRGRLFLLSDRPISPHLIRLLSFLPLSLQFPSQPFQ